MAEEIAPLRQIDPIYNICYTGARIMYDERDDGENHGRSWPVPVRKWADVLYVSLACPIIPFWDDTAFWGTSGRV